MMNNSRTLSTYIHYVRIGSVVEVWGDKYCWFNFMHGQYIFHIISYMPIECVKQFSNLLYYLIFTPHTRNVREYKIYDAKQSEKFICNWYIRKEIKKLNIPSRLLLIYFHAIIKHIKISSRSDVAATSCIRCECKSFPFFAHSLSRSHIVSLVYTFHKYIDTFSIKFNYPRRNICVHIDILISECYRRKKNCESSLWGILRFFQGFISSEKKKLSKFLKKLFVYIPGNFLKILHDSYFWKP